MMTRSPRDLSGNSDPLRALFLRGVAAHREGRLVEAAECYARVAEARPKDADALANLAACLFGMGRFPAAAEVLQRLLVLKPRQADAWMNLGLCRLRLDVPAAARECLERAVALAPRNADARMNLGVCLSMLGEYAAARPHLEKAAAAMPGSAAALANLARCHFRANEYAAARECLEKALALAPGFAEGHMNLGLCLRRLGEHAAARASLERAIALKPGYAEAHMNLGLCLLREGDFVAGFGHYEWRFAMPGPQKKLVELQQPPWRAGEDIRGRTVLLRGDTLQFCRFARRMADLGASVALEVQPPLLSLLAGLEGVSTLLAQGDPLPGFDRYCPLMSVPRALALSAADIPAEVPYLTADPAKAARWKERLAAAGGPRVGVVWSGNSAFANDHNRSMPLRTFAAMLPEGLRCVSLQKEVPESDRAELAVRSDILDIGAELADFSDTAAVCSCLDLVVSVDTSAAHLAGAMGVPLRVLLPSAADWRWGIGRADSPWYPSARLLRQELEGDWSPVVAAMRRELAAFVPA